MIHTEARLEQWMRQYYFATEIDIGSSGVESYSFGELRRLLGLAHEELDAVVFDDSQTLGGDDLRRAIARRWAGGRVERVMATHGSSEALYLVLNALLERDDEVVVLEPIYPQFFNIAEALGCRLRRWRLHAEQQFVPDLGELGRLLTPRTRMVITNFPHNPTGASMTAGQQAELVEMVARTGAYLLWDAAFAEMTYGQPPLPDPGLVYERALTLGTLSKAYGLPGLRVGWLLAAPEVLARCVRLRDYVTLHLSPLVELVAARAVEHADELLRPRAEQARANLDILHEWAAGQEGLVEWVEPRGGVCAFPRLGAVADVEAFCHELASRHSVLLVPGTCFEQPQHVRLGFGGATPALREGLARLARMLRQTT